MNNYLTEKVPRYFEPYVNDCFHNAYGAVLQYMGLNPTIILADYLSFMYDRESGDIGVNYFYRMNTSVEFKEENLNTSLEFAYLPSTEVFSSVSENYREVRFKDRVNINMYIDDNQEVAHSRLKFLIDSGKPVVAAVDLYNMSYHRAYKKDHGIHCIVITGYNEKEGWFELFDKYKSSSSDFDGRMPITEVNEGRMSENPITWTNGLFKRPIRNLWMEIYADNNFQISDEKLLNILNESYSRMTGEKLVFGHECGLKALDCFISDLLLKKEAGLDNDNKHWDWFRGYLSVNFRNMSRNRKRFMAFVNEISHLLSDSLVQDVCNYLEESAKKWEISSNLSLKLGIKKSTDLIDELIKHLREICVVEGFLVKKLESFLKSGSV